MIWEDEFRTTLIDHNISTGLLKVIGTGVPPLPMDANTKTGFVMGWLKIIVLFPELVFCMEFWLGILYDAGKLLWSGIFDNAIFCEELYVYAIPFIVPVAVFPLAEGTLDHWKFELVHSSISNIPSLSSSSSHKSVILSPSLSAPLTVTSNEQVAVLPAKSVLIHVLVVTPIGNRLPLGRPVVWTVLVEPQLSVAVGVVKLITELQEPKPNARVTSEGQLANSGDSKSVLEQNFCWLKSVPVAPVKPQ